MSIDTDAYRHILQEYICQYPPAKELWDEIEESFREPIKIEIVDLDLAKHGAQCSWMHKIAPIDGIYETISKSKPLIYIANCLKWYKMIEFVIVELYNLKYSDVYDQLTLDEQNGKITVDEHVKQLEDFEYNTVIDCMQKLVSDGVAGKYYEPLLLANIMDDPLDKNIRHPEHTEKTYNNIMNG